MLPTTIGGLQPKIKKRKIRSTKFREFWQNSENFDKILGILTKFSEFCQNSLNFVDPKKKTFFLFVFFFFSFFFFVFFPFFFFIFIFLFFLFCVLFYLLSFFGFDFCFFFGRGVCVLSTTQKMPDKLVVGEALDPNHLGPCGGCTLPQRIIVILECASVSCSKAIQFNAYFIQQNIVTFPYQSLSLPSLHLTCVLVEDLIFTHVLLLSYGKYVYQHVL